MGRADSQHVLSGSVWPRAIAPLGFGGSRTCPRHAGHRVVSPVPHVGSGLRSERCDQP